MRLLLFGCTGFIGSELVPRLLEEGHQIVLVGRNPCNHYQEAQKEGRLDYLRIDPADILSWEEGPLSAALFKAEGVVNFAGEPIADKRWTKAHLERIENSRLITTKSLTKAMCQLKRPPKVLVNASAIGYYGTSQEEKFTETSPCGTDFLSNLCNRWEDAASQKPRQTRLVVLRLGIVLGPNGGALGKMLPVFKAGFGGPLGSGNQWMSWIHRTDVCNLVANSLDNRSWSGVFNSVAPQPVSMRNFSSSLARCLGRPSLLAVPATLLKLLLGDGAKVVLEGQYVTSDKLQKLKFNLNYPQLDEALAEITTSSDDRKILS